MPVFKPLAVAEPVLVAPFLAAPVFVEPAGDVPGKSGVEGVSNWPLAGSGPLTTIVASTLAISVATLLADSRRGRRGP
jgi:hypothetical protein